MASGGLYAKKKRLLRINCWVEIKSSFGGKKFRLGHAEGMQRSPKQSTPLISERKSGVNCI